MKTVKLYEIDSYLKECECVVQAVTDYNEKPALILQETIFYPLGEVSFPTPERWMESGSSMWSKKTV